jgi:hypothetical protein
MPGHEAGLEDGLRAEERRAEEAVEEREDRVGEALEQARAPEATRGEEADHAPQGEAREPGPGRPVRREKGHREGDPGDEHGQLEAGGRARGQAGRQEPGLVGAEEQGEEQRQNHQEVPGGRAHQRERVRPDSGEDRGQEGERTPLGIRGEHAPRNAVDEHHVQPVQRPEQEPEDARRQVPDAEVVEPVLQRIEEGLQSRGGQILVEAPVNERVAVVEMVVAQVVVEVGPEAEGQHPREEGREEGEQRLRGDPHGFGASRRPRRIHGADASMPSWAASFP